MARELKTEAEVQEVLESARFVAVLGAHPSKVRPAFYVPDYLHEQGYTLLPVNRMKVGETLWGQAVVGRLDELKRPVDVVDVFRRADALPAHLDEILGMDPKPKLVWLQLGIQNDAFAQDLVDAGINVIQSRCMLADHKRMGLGPR